MDTQVGKADFVFIHRDKAKWEHGHDRRAVACHVQRHLEQARAACSNQSPSAATKSSGLKTVRSNKLSYSKQEPSFGRFSLRGTKGSLPMTEQRLKPAFLKSRKTSKKDNSVKSKASQLAPTNATAQIRCIEPEDDDSAIPGTREACKSSTVAQISRSLPNEIPLRLDEYAQNLAPLVRNTFVFQNLQYMLPGALDRWLTVSAQLDASAHALCAFALAFASRSATSETHRLDLKHKALLHNKEAISELRVSIEHARGRKHLMQLGSAITNIGVYSFVVGDFSTLPIHVDFKTRLFEMMGGFESLDITNQLIHLLAGAHQAIFSLTRPRYEPETWNHLRRPKILATACKSYGVIGNFTMSPTVLIFQNKGMIRLFTELKMFHELLFMFRHYNENVAESGPLQFQLDLQFHLLKLKLVNAYCDLEDSMVLPKVELHQCLHSYQTQSLKKTFMIALMCYHQMLYCSGAYAMGTSKSYYAPLTHLRSHLEQIVAQNDALSQFYLEGVEMLLWISFIGAHEELDGNENLQESPGWYKCQFTRFLDHLECHDSVQEVLELFLYDDAVSEPVLQYLTRNLQKSETDED